MPRQQGDLGDLPYAVGVARLGAARRIGVLLPLVLCSFLVQGGLGQVTVPGFKAILERNGFKHVVVQSLMLNARSGSVGFQCRLSVRPEKGGQETVVGLVVATTFALPKMLPRTDLAAWLKRERMARLEGRSFLNGTVELTTSIPELDKTAESDLAAILRAFALAGSDFESSYKQAKALEPGDKLSDIPLDPTIRLDSVDERDVAFIHLKMGWEFKKGWGASSNGWVFPATIRRIDFWFHEMVNPQENGVPAGHSGFYVELNRRYDPAWTKNWCRQNADRIAWAKVFGQEDGGLILVHFVDLAALPTVGEIISDIDRFADNVGALNLPTPKA